MKEPVDDSERKKLCRLSLHDFVKFEEGGCTDDREYLECKYCHAYLTLGDRILRAHDGTPLGRNHLMDAIIEMLRRDCAENRI